MTRSTNFRTRSTDSPRVAHSSRNLTTSERLFNHRIRP
nr:hypothetical protein JVH1_4703 [Rhodococcus sp. JVH1]